ncbi:hypothetical protein BD779DRAFT_512587 [Infundibulicybe gibba]|nr:hypothetical protein BD779DRAFT_512587 [Infundibulicybe gibba]
MIPPNLIYLTIYNPSLTPAGPVASDDEDAEEQAHILFYTSKERAVSRDKILRQIGLAKALVNFSQTFSPSDPCGSVHSQTRRMVMLSPEPNFWIHAGIEVAKSPHVGVDKGKAKAKSPRPGEKTRAAPVPEFDYVDGSLIDEALREELMSGYEAFKLSHGSFGTILETLGQQALELQLERFFTVWAWSWNLEDGHESSSHLGVPLHPLFHSIRPELDAFNAELGHPNSAAIILAQPYAAPSSQYINRKYPAALTQHLLSQLARPVPPPSIVDGTVKGRTASPPVAETQDAGGTFFGVPTGGVNMDVRKWGWTGYLTFGKTAGRKPSAAPPEVKGLASYSEGPSIPAAVGVDVEVDKHALDDAIASDGITQSFSSSSSVTDAEKSAQPGSSRSSISLPADTSTGASPPTTEVDEVAVAVGPPSPAASPPPIPQLKSLSVHLSEPPGTQGPATRRQKVYFLLHGDTLMLALVGIDAGLELESEVLTDIAARSAVLLHTIHDITAREALKSMSESQLPSATRILQPRDRYAVSAAGLAVSSSGFTLHAGHLWNARALQMSDPAIVEVFSRGQNPQYWHVARRGLRVELGLEISEESTDSTKKEEGEVYLEVFRKEASLSDVDNELAGIVRKSGIVDVYNS